MADLSGRRCLRGRGHTRLTGEDGALRTPDDRTAEGRTDHLILAEGTGEDQLEDGGQLGDVQEENDECHDDVDTGHERDDLLGDRADTLHAAEDDEGERGSDDETGDPLGNTERDDDGLGNGVGVDARLRQGEADHGDDGEDVAQRVRLEEAADVVGRATAVLTVDLLLEELCHRTLDERGRRAQNGDHPHPKQCTGAAVEDGRGHARDVARTHTARNGHAEGLERGQTRFGFLSVEQESHHVLDVPHLHEAQRDREDQAAAEADVDQGHGPNVVVQCVCEITQKCTHLVTSLLIFFVFSGYIGSTPNGLRRAATTV